MLLFLVIAPFFTSFLIRTISWRIILGNDGPFLGVRARTLGIVPDNFSVLGTPLAVVAGLTYQFLPFMVLPLYVASRRSTGGWSRRRRTCTPDRGGAAARSSARSSAALLAGVT